MDKSNIKKLIKNDLKKVKQEPMSNFTIEKYLKNPEIIEYSELKNYKDIDELLPNNNDYVIILYRHDTGAHWVVALKQNNLIEHFCSYGSNPDQYYNEWATQLTNMKLGQDEPYLSKLLNNCNYEVIYNPIKYQTINNDIATCGRHCLNRVFHMLNHNTNLNDYFKYMKRKKKELNKPYDDLVSIIVNRLNN